MTQETQWHFLSAVPEGNEMKMGDHSQVKLLVAGFEVAG